MKKFIYVTLKVTRGLAIAAGTSALLASGAHAAAVDLGLWNAESYGAGIPHPDGNEVPTIRDFPFTEPQKILDLLPLDLYKSGRWPMVLKAAKITREALPHADIRLPLGGPFSIAVNLCGFENFLLYAFMNESEASEILTKLADHQIHLARQIHQEGFGVSFFAKHTCSCSYNNIF